MNARFAQLSPRTRQQLQRALADVRGMDDLSTKQARSLIRVESMPERDRRVLAEWALFELLASRVEDEVAVH